MTNSTRIRRNYQIQCPACRVGVGQPCKGKLGERLPGVHFQRTTALRRASLAAFRSLYAPLKTAALLVCLLVCSVAVAPSQAEIDAQREAQLEAAQQARRQQLIQAWLAMQNANRTQNYNVDVNVRNCTTFPALCAGK